MSTLAQPLVPAQAEPVPSPAAPPPVAVELADRGVPELVHAHGRSCWWNLAECRWECGPT